MPALFMSVGLVVKPRMYGNAYSASMPGRSAPSPKIFTPRSAIVFMKLSDRFPFGRTSLQQRMRDEQVPDDGLVGLGVRRHPLGVHCGNDDTGVRDRRCISAVASHDAE